MPKVFAKPPRVKVMPRTDVFYENEEELTSDERIEAQKKHDTMARAVQDYLRVFFKDAGIERKLKLWAKNTAGYGDGFIQVVPKYKIQRSKTKDRTVEEKFISFGADVDVVSWQELYYDPHYRVMDDMPAIIRVKRSVRLQSLYFEKNDDGEDKYFNLDKLEEIANTQYSTEEAYSTAIEQITGIVGLKTSQ
jgi:hypothetical protein